VQLESVEALIAIQVPRAIVPCEILSHARHWDVAVRRQHDGDQRIGQASRVLPTTAGAHCQVNNSVLLSYQIAFDRLDGLCEQQR